LRHATSIACAVLIGCWASGLLAQEPAAEPRTPADESIDEQTPERSPSALLEQFGISESFFAGFVDGEPLDAPQREKLLTLLDRMRRMGPWTLEKFEKSTREIALIGQNPAEFRGDVVAVPGLVSYVVREELAPELRERFQIDAWYRCRVTTYLGTGVTVYTLSVPQAWPLEELAPEFSHSLAMFVKVLPPSAEKPTPGSAERISRRSSLLFVTPRISWYPQNLLGRLGMDFALFDDVHDRGPLEERECFYQMLSAVRRAEDGQIERAGRNEIAERRDYLERMVRNPHQLSKDRAAAQRALERGKDDCDDIVPLFNDPAGQRGKLFLLWGEALRAIKIRVDDPDIVKRFGIGHYYEIEIITADSQNNPIVCCVAEVPPDMPLGESIHQSVRIAGFFLKSWAFDARKSAGSDSSPGQKQRRQLAPLLIAKTVRVLKPPAPRPPSVILPACLVVLVVLGAALIWYVRRGDRWAMAKAAGFEVSLPTRIPFDASQDAADDSASGDR
jgi:hypothetical protein